MKNKNILIVVALLLLLAFLIWYFGFRNDGSSPVATDAPQTEKAVPAAEQTGPTVVTNSVTGPDGKIQDITTFFAARDSAIVLEGGVSTLPSLNIIDHQTDGDQLIFQLPMARFFNYNISFSIDRGPAITTTMSEQNPANPGVMLVENVADLLENIKKAKHIEVSVHLKSEGKKSIVFIGK